MVLQVDEAFDEAIDLLFLSRESYVQASNIFHKAASIRQAVLAMIVAADSFCHLVKYDSPLSKSIKNEVRENFGEYREWASALSVLEKHIPELAKKDLPNRLNRAVSILEHSHMPDLKHLLKEDFKALFNESWNFIMSLAEIMKNI